MVRCGEKVLTFVSLGFGLVATGALALAVATEYWLFTSEPFVPPPDAFGDGEISVEESISPIAEENNTLGQNDTYLFQDEHFTIKVHSGLWRMCVEMVEGAIRKSSPAIVFSLLLILVGFILSTLGNTRRDHKTVAAAVIYVFAALFLAVGVILYISAVNDEVAHKKTPNPDGTVFQYYYGWAFFFAGSSFITTLVAAVTNISLYLKRYPTIEEMVSVIPGLERKRHLDFRKDVSEDDLDTTVVSQNPTVIL